MKRLGINININIIATLGIVAIEISELTFLLILYFHGKNIPLRGNTV